MVESGTAPSLRISDLLEEIRDLQRRVTLLEERAGLVAAQTAQPAIPAPQPETLAVSEATTTGIITVLGRAMLGIAGAYLLRALSESGTIPSWLGVIATVLYAAGWLKSSQRAAQQSSVFSNIYGATAAAILYPMLWETAVRFQALPPAATAAILALFATTALAIAWRGNLVGIVWITMFSSVATALALILATHHIVPFAAALLVVTAAAEFSAWRDHWVAVRGIASSAADLAVLLALYLASSPSGLPEGYAHFTAAEAVMLAMGLLVISLAGTVVRTLVRGLDITLLEVAQLLAVAAIAIGGTLRIANASGGGHVLIGSIAFAAGAVCYLVAFAYLDHAIGKDRNLYAYSTIALALVSVGSSILLSGPALAATLSVAAFAAVTIGGRTSRPIVSLHGLIYLVLAALSSGALLNAIQRIVTTPLPLQTAEAIVILGAVACYGALLILEHKDPSNWREGFRPFAHAALLCILLVGLLCGAVAGTVATTMSYPLRTGLLTIFGIAIAAAARLRARSELRWLVYPWTLMAGYKLIAQDFQYGNTAGCAVSLLCLGAALMLLPRLLKREA